MHKPHNETVRLTNKVRTKTLGDACLVTLDDAREAAREFLTYLQLGIDANEVCAIELAEEKYKAITLSDALESYVNDRESRHKTIVGYRYARGYTITKYHQIGSDF